MPTPSRIRPEVSSTHPLAWRVRESVPGTPKLKSQCTSKANLDMVIMQAKVQPGYVQTIVIKKILK
jgi:hypothetical protein